MPWYGWMTVSEPESAVADRHTKGGGERPGGGGVVYGPADDSAAEHIEHDCAADLAFSGWMLGAGRSPTIGPADGGRSSGRPDLVGYQPVCVAAVWDLGSRSGPARPARLMSITLSVVPDPDSMTQLQLSMDPRCSIRPTGLLMDLVDEISQPGVADGPSRGWAVSPLVETGFRHSKHPARHLAALPLAPHDLDRFVPPFGDTTWAFSSSLARLVTARSVSSSAMRRRAALSFSFSPDAQPGSRPRSTASWRRQLYIVWSDTPRSADREATDLPAATGPGPSGRTRVDIDTA